MLSWLNTLPGSVAGPLWMLASAAGFAAMTAVVKYLGESLPSVEIAFFRTLVGLILILLLLGVSRDRWPLFRTHRPWLMLTRAVVGTAAMVCLFYSMIALPLAMAVSLSFSRPLFLVPLAVLFLAEPVRWRRWSATAVGFLGVVVMLEPAQAALEPAALVALLGAFLVAVVLMLIKRLAATEAPLTVMFYFALPGTLVLFTPALLVWQTPTAGQMGLLVLTGGLGTLGQYAAVRAFRAAEATLVAPFDYAQLPFATGVGYAMFGEVPGLSTLIGALIIVGAALYILQRETRSPAAPPREGPS